MYDAPHSTTPPQPSLAESQHHWKQRFWRAYREQIPVMVVAAILGFTGFVWLYSPHFAHLGDAFTITVATLSVIGLPIFAVPLVLAQLGPYPTKARHEMNEELRQLYLAISQEDTSPSAEQRS